MNMSSNYLTYSKWLDSDYLRLILGSVQSLIWLQSQMDQYNVMLWLERVHIKKIYRRIIYNFFTHLGLY